MSHNVHTSHVSCRPSSAVVSAGVIGHSSSSRSSVAVNNNNNSGNNNMNHINSSQPASWGHSTNGSSQNAAGSASNQHGASPRTPSGADYDKATTVPSPQSSSGSQGTTLKEHDLLGLSDVSSTNASRLDNSPDRSDFTHDGLNLNLNLGATELRLGPQDEKQSAGFHFGMGGAGAGVPELGAPVATETGNFLELDAGGIGTELDACAADRRSSNVDQKVANSELHQEQGSDRGFSYSSLNGDRASTQGGRAEMMEGSACRPLIESESLQKWHGATDRKAPNEGFSLSMSLVQQQQQNMKSDDLSEKNLFHNPGDRNYNEAPQEVTVQQQHQEWQERKQHNVAQDDFSTSEKGVGQDQVMSEKSTPLDLQQGTEKPERMNHEGFQVDKRNLSEGKALAALQLPEPRFPQDMSTVPSPRQADYLVQQKLWQSQMLMRSQMGAPEFQTQQQQQQMPLPSQDDSSRNAFTLSHNGNFQGTRGVFLPSKPAVSGAKRAFDTIGTGSEARNFNESRVSSVSESPSMMNANSASSDADAKLKAQPPSYQAWGPRGPTWQMLHTGGSFGPFPSQAPARSQIITKPTGEGGSGGGDAAQKAWEAHSKNLQQQDPSTSISQKVGSCPSESKPAPAQAPSTPSEAGSLPRAAAAAAAPASHAVGWPPLRSYRKNSIAAHPRPSPVETQTRPPPPPPPQAASPASVASQPNSWFVKVYMDGVPFGRKVDLKTNRSYEKLSLVLEDMFRGFVVNGQKSSRDTTLPSDKRNFLHGSDYVLTYEDQDGDLMLVGDVPWTMFIDTVKRLRIMKGSEAIGLGTRAAEKVNKVQLTA